ncbi:MAG: AraC family transcriptional regulator [Sideroxydans sp.]|nr:AraC family transcriptional regulator [Sideroxydans sp.]
MAVNTSRADLYAARFNKVFDFIDQHLDESLSVEQLSQVAHFSKFHFHRQFSDYCGISVMRYIQLMRLKRASYRLVFNTLERITDIALDAGFENPESFSRAFKNTFGQTPSEFRQQPKWQPWNERYRFPNIDRSKQMEVKIWEFEETPIAVLEHRGPPDLVNDSVVQFIDWRKTSGLSPIKTSDTFGIVYDNPDTTAPADFRFDICGSVTEAVPANPQGVVNKRIPAGRCAVVRHQGSHQRIGEAAYYLYRDWLPNSGEELRDFPLFFHYLNLMPDTPEHELLTDVYLPLK